MSLFVNPDGSISGLHGVGSVGEVARYRRSRRYGHVPPSLSGLGKKPPTPQQRRRKKKKAKAQGISVKEYNRRRSEWKKYISALMYYAAHLRSGRAAEAPVAPPFGAPNAALQSEYLRAMERVNSARAPEAPSSPPPTATNGGATNTGTGPPPPPATSSGGDAGSGGGGDIQYSVPGLPTPTGGEGFDSLYPATTLDTNDIATAASDAITTTPAGGMPAATKVVIAVAVVGGAWWWWTTRRKRGRR